MMAADLRIFHTPVLRDEVLEALNVVPGGRYIDATTGEGGHAEAILRASAPDGALLGLDADPEALEIAGRRLSSCAGSYDLVQSNFSDLARIARDHRFDSVDGVLFDLGLSSRQLEGEERGFTFLQDQPLDMRFDPRQEVSAADLLNDLPQEELAQLFRDYAQEPRAGAIARSIAIRRPLRSTGDLVAAVQAAVGQRSAERIHPSTKVFMGLRIVVNHEVTALEAALPQALKTLAPAGRLVVISYHSLEDRIVKDYLRRESRDCVCPPGLPVCVCGHVATLRLIGRGVVTPTPAAIARNPRGRSARLRTAERLSSPPEAA